MLGIFDKVTDRANHTKERILMESARLFAVRGYDAVSTRDIAAAVEVRASSIYAHYASKEEILQELLQRTDTLLANYYTRLSEANEAADSIEELMDNFFHELRDMYTIFTYYGVSTARVNMMWHEGARHTYMDSFLGAGRRTICDGFDRAIVRGLVQPFDTQSIANLIMNTVSAGNDLRIAEREGIDVGLDFHDYYDNLCDFLLGAVKRTKVLAG